MIRLALRVRRDQAELALAELLDLAPDGVEEIDLGAKGIEYAVYGPPGELPSLPDLRVAVGEALVDVSTSEVRDDWADRWRRFHRPVTRSPRADARPEVPALHVRPPWESPPRARQGSREVQDIVIDPAQAFGTGAHATTRMCLDLLLELAACGLARGGLVDVGCGSGVLSIAAARLGWSPVLGLDHEIESVTATSQNAAVNRVRVEARAFDLRAQALPAVAAPTVIVANLLRPLLVHLARTMVAAPAHLLASGLLNSEVEAVVGEFGDRLGLTVRDRRTAGDWSAVWMQGPAP